MAGNHRVVACGLVELARYDVRTTTVLEDRALVGARVFAMDATPPR
jgi:hypothetical protein